MIFYGRSNRTTNKHKIIQAAVNTLLFVLFRYHFLSYLFSRNGQRIFTRTLDSLYYFVLSTIRSSSKVFRTSNYDKSSPKFTKFQNRTPSLSNIIQIKKCPPPSALIIIFHNVLLIKSKNVQFMVPFIVV